MKRARITTLQLHSVQRSVAHHLFVNKKSNRPHSKALRYHSTHEFPQGVKFDSMLPDVTHPTETMIVLKTFVKMV